MHAFQKWTDKIFYDVRAKQFIVVNNVLAIVTLISVLALILETVASLEPYHSLFTSIEYITVVFFTLEYVGRIFARKKDVFSYVFSFFGVIDLLSIVPTYFGLANLTFLKTARVLRILRLLRMVRLAKVARIKHPNKKDLESYGYLYRLNLQIYFAALFAAVTLFGTIIYIIEGGGATFASIPLGMLWAVKLLLGGITQAAPTTTLGELLAVLTRFTGLVLFGLLITVVGTTVRKFLFGTKY